MVTISGNANDPASMGQPSATFKITSTVNLGNVYIGSTSDVVCDQNGAYSSTLNLGTYSVSADYGQGFKKIGVATVTDSTPSTVELSEIL